MAAAHAASPFNTLLAQLNGGKSAIVGLRRRNSGLFASRSEILLRCTRGQSKIRPQRQAHRQAATQDLP